MSRQVLPPLPPLEYMRLVCGDHPDLEAHFVERSRSIVQRLRHHGMLNDGARILDIGCGCGRVARQLLAEKQIAAYSGFDRHPGMIEWCDRYLASADSRFRFDFIPLESPYAEVDGHIGEIPIQQFRFPYDDDSFDGALAASVFTHMPQHEASRYLEELKRVLTAPGRALVTVFITSSDEPYSSGHNFFYRREDFHAQVEAVGFGWRELENPRPESVQNWFELLVET